MANGDPVIQGATHAYTLPTELRQTNPNAPEGLRVESPTNGVVGVSQTSAGISGHSEAPAPQFDKAGVRGRSDRATGVVGISTDDIGVKGFSFNYIGVVGLGQEDAGVYGHSVKWTGVVGSTDNQRENFAGFFWGAVGVQGPLFIFGKKAAAVPHQDGSHRLLYSIESPESWFEDVGRARLVRGRAAVRLDREFANVVRLKDYHVFLTAEGDSAGLYVSRRTRHGFEVREQGGGAHTLAFSYRIVARRKDVTVRRFEKVKLPRKPTPPQSKAGGPRRGR